LEIPVKNYEGCQIWIIQNFQSIWSLFAGVESKIHTGSMFLIKNDDSNKIFNDEGKLNKQKFFVGQTFSSLIFCQRKSNNLKENLF